MKRRLLHSKIHRATVTQADLNYEGSITIPPELMELADLLEYQEVSVWNVTRGSRLTTYAIGGKENSNDICINGAAAHLVDPGDLVIIASFCDLEGHEAQQHKPKLVFVDKNNRPMATRAEVPGPELLLT